MSLSEKPFACNEKNCTMTFANEDHLNSHQKKHLMSFDLEFSGKDASALLGDQTPTPTSFFRNCEEVGLFQDLQNVNPFEETFKKALESSSSDASKLGSLSILSNEDTLHTPHIFPVDEHPKSVTSNENNNELSIANFIEIPELSEKMHIITDIDSNLKLKENRDNFKAKLKNAILRKEKEKNLHETPNSNIIITDNILILNSTTLNKCQISDKPKESNSNTQKPHIQTIREMNRAAQIRCRNKKKKLFNKLTTEFEILKKENAKLKNENTKLKKQNAEYFKIIVELGGSDRISLAHTLYESDDSNAVGNTLKKLPILAPATKITPPVIYNLVPINVVGTNKFSTSLPTLSPEVKKRKTLPAILRKT